MITYQKSYQIRSTAINLFETYSLSNLRKTDLKSILTFLEYDISCHMSDLKGLSGFTCYDQDNDKYGIFLDSSIHFFFPTRTRFTIAHELGHIILGHFDSVHSNSAFIGDPVMEYEANEFAEELLMPTLPIIELHMNNRDIISIYQVSSSAAINKLRFMKRNPIFLKYQAEKEKELSFMRQINTSHHRRDQRDRIVDQLHERWLDPDYAFI